MKKNGFTLVELIAIVTLLGLLMLVVYPKITELAEKKQSEIDSAKQQLINNAAIEYMDSNLNSYPQDIGATYCFELRMLDNENLIPTDITDVLEQYNYLRVKIGLNNNHNFTLIEAESEEKCKQP